MDQMKEPSDEQFHNAIDHIADAIRDFKAPLHDQLQAAINAVSSILQDAMEERPEDVWEQITQIGGSLGAILAIAGARMSVKHGLCRNEEGSE